MAISSSETENAVYVEVDLYSGKPNPGWHLDAIEAQAFLRHLNNLPQSGLAEGAELDSGPGYRGLKIEIRDKKNPSTIAIARGEVSIMTSDSPQKRRLRDNGRQLERKLLEAGRGHLDGQVYDYLVDEISRQSG
jgi:hypothetical protein